MGINYNGRLWRKFYSQACLFFSLKLISGHRNMLLNYKKNWYAHNLLRVLECNRSIG